MNALVLGALEIELAIPIAVLLTVAVAFSVARMLYRQGTAAPAERSRAWRIALLVLAQPLCASLLYFALFPLGGTGEAVTLVIATAGTTTGQLETIGRGEAVVALPEAPVLPAAERAPDLATALRRHPGTRRLRVVGAGFEARDRAAVRKLAVEFHPAPLPRGLVDLEVPSRVAAGNEFGVSGRAEGLRGGAVELLDPGGRPVDRTVLDADGHFALSATTRGPGVATYRLRLRDALQQPVEDVELPQQVDVDVQPRVLILAGASNAEVKYLRRWARDAGLALHTQIAAGGGLELGDVPLPMNAETLSHFDVAVLDERAWSAMSDAQRAALDEALHDGLGVLLRITAPLSAAERRRLGQIGFAVDAGRDSAKVRFASRGRDDAAERARLGPGTRDAPRASDAAVAEVPGLTRRTLRIDAEDALPLLRDDAGASLAIWRAAGRGRVALWTLTDSFRLVLTGRGDLHGELWSDAIATLARPQAQRPLHVEGNVRQGQRAVVCGLGDEARVISPAGVTTPLLRDPASGARSCGAFWPQAPGWHRLQTGERNELVHVRARDTTKGLHAAEIREATLRIAVESQRSASITTLPVSSRPTGARWPWWLGWLVASAALWWLERSRAGRVVHDT